MTGGLLLLLVLTACFAAKPYFQENRKRIAEAAVSASGAPAEETAEAEAAAEETAAEEALPAVPESPTPTERVRRQPPPEPTPLPTPAPTPEPSAPPEPSPEWTGYKGFRESDLPADSVVDPYVEYSYEQMCEDVYALAERYPELISVFTAGWSVEGRPLLCFDLGKGKREVIVIASMHACENITTNAIMYIADQYCQGYEHNGSYNGLSYREILDNVRFRIMPMSNPDGVNLAQNGLDAVSARRREGILGMGWGKNSSFVSWKSNIRGVDLNGNFRHRWGIKDEVVTAGDAGWCGPKPMSEPETLAMQSLLDGSDYYMFISLHIRGEVVYWIDTDTTYLYDTHYRTAKRFARAFGYELLGPEDVSNRGGYIVNTARVETGKFCATFELCPYKKDPYPAWMFPDVIDNVYAMLLIAGDEAMGFDELSTAVDVRVNGSLIPFWQQRPVFEGETLLAPAARLLESLGIEREWDEELQLLRLRRNGRECALSLGGDTLIRPLGFGLMTEKLPEPLQYRDGCLMLPVVPVLEALGFACEWREETQTLEAWN